MLDQGAPKGTKDHYDTDLSSVMTEEEIEQYLALQKKYTSRQAGVPGGSKVASQPSYTYKDLNTTGYTAEDLARAKQRYPDPSESGVSGGLLGDDDLAGYYQDQRGRIPRGNELEGMSSDTIAGLLNPPDFFPEVDRRSAESASGRGIAGSPAGFATGVKMTDDEKLKRIALGQGFLTAAAGRNPAIDPSFLYQTPQQKAQLELDKQRLALQKQALDLENELKRLQIRNLSTISVSGLSGGGIFRRAEAPAPYDPAFTEDKMAAADAAFGQQIGGWGGTGGNDLPPGFDPNFDYTG